MIIIVHAARSGGLRDTQRHYVPHPDAEIVRFLGTPDYSYFFVLRQFMPVLEELGTVVLSERPEREVDAIFDLCRHFGEPCVFLSFTPPHKTLCDLRCPTIPVFAWEYPDIPDETWNGIREHDWRHVLKATGRAITHSRFASDAVRKSMGEAYPVLTVPSPIWEDFRSDAPCAPRSRMLELGCDTMVLDTRPGGGSTFGERVEGGVLSSFTFEPEEFLDGDPGDRDDARVLRLDGVVYTYVLNPMDGRKNWEALLQAFCAAFSDTPDAVLVLKSVNRNSIQFCTELVSSLYALTPFRCRIVALPGYLEEREYRGLIEATTFAVNTSKGEGQCLPLMEYMSLGKPAVAPLHTAMRDYLTAENGFPVESHAVPSFWPEDTRQKLRTVWYMVDHQSLVSALSESYSTAMGDPDRYEAMSRNACETMRGHCSKALIKGRLDAFLNEGLDP